MVTLKIPCFWLVLLCTAWLYIPHLHLAGGEVNAFSTTKLRGDSTAVRSMIGRKIVVKSVEKQDVKGNGATRSSSEKKQQDEFKLDSTKSAFITCVRCKNGLGRHFTSKEMDDSSSVVFTADYHRPSHHPPKNN